MRGNIMRSFILAAGLVGTYAIGSSVSAATLSASVADVEYAEPFVGEGELAIVLADVDGSTGAMPNGFATLDIVAGFGTADPTDSSDFAFGGFLDVSDDDGQFLVGDLSSISFGTDLIELSFNNLIGNAAGSFGSTVIATISFDDMPGADPFSAFVDGKIYGASVDISSAVAPVPLPAGLPLLIAGIGGLAVVRRKTKSAS